MKTIEKVELIEKTVTKYVAEDGTEFLTRAACMDYELRKALDGLDGIECCLEAENHPNIDAGEYMENHGYRWFRPHSKEDVDALNNAFKAGELGSSRLEYDAIGEWICVETDGYDSFIWSSFLSDGINYAEDLLAKFGYRVEITKESGEQEK